MPLQLQAESRPSWPDFSDPLTRSWEPIIFSGFLLTDLCRLRGPGVIGCYRLLRRGSDLLFKEKLLSKSSFASDSVSVYYHYCQELHGEVLQSISYLPGRFKLYLTTEIESSLHMLMQKKAFV